MKSLLSLPILLLLPTGQAVASEGSFGVGVSGGAVVTDPLEVIDSSWVVVPRLSYWYNPTLAVELDLGFTKGRTAVGVPDTFNYTAYTPRLGVTGRVFDDQPLNLLLSVGAGAYMKSVADGGALELPVGEKMDVDFLGNAGPGLMLPLGDSGMAIRTDLRFLLNLGSENYQRRGDAFLSWEWSAGVTFGVPSKPDADKDGIVDADDSCVDEPEDFDGYNDVDGCPDPDNDQDGVADVDDQCDGEAEDLDQFEDADGCPDPDNDEDGIADIDDQCPNEAGPAATQGCPDDDGDEVANAVDECEDEAGPRNSFGCPDQDEDRVPDYRDECPEEAVLQRVNPLRSNGCPGRVMVADNALVITETIQFDTGRATIKKASHELLADIAAALEKHEGLKKLQIEGHTDDQGDDEKNLALSQERAEAVKQWLVEHGQIAATRLEARGFGETKPVADNSTADGRTQNRRVEFLILEQDEAEPRKRRARRTSDEAAPETGADE